MADPRHDPFMALALEQAEAAAREGEVPIGAVIVDAGGTVLGTGRNTRERAQDPLGHAEIHAIARAAQATGSWRLENTTLYVTLEPCPMCAGAIVNARIPTVVYGAADPKAGACRSVYALLEDPRLNHRCTVVPGVRAQEAAALLQRFFADLRAQGKK